MKRSKFIDQMAQGKISRRQMMQAAGAFGAAFTLLPARVSASTGLTVLEWSGYDDPAYYPAYYQAHGKPNVSIFSGEEEALTKVLAGFRADVMHPCNYSVTRFVDAGVARPIDTARLSHWNDVFDEFKTASGVVSAAGDVVMAPADWGNSTIIYRSDMIPERYHGENMSWGMFMDEELTNRVSMLDNDVAVTITGMVMGHSYEEMTRMSAPEDLAKIKEGVQRMANTSRFLWSDPTEIQQALASGEIVAAYGWNDALANLQRDGIPIEFGKPKEGYFTWYCGITLLNRGDGDDVLAHEFVDAWLSPETGRHLIESSGYGHANRKSFETANPEAVAAMGIVEPIAHMQSAILFQPQGADVIEAQTTMWEEAKALKR